MVQRRAVAVILGTLAACKGSQQSFRQGMELICNAEAAADADKSAPIDRPRIVSAWIKAHVHNPEALEVFGALSTMARADGADHVAAAATRAGLASCPLVAMMVAPPAMVRDGITLPDPDQPDD